MDKQVKKLLVDALRSGEYKKTEGFLRRDGGFCFYGVLCDLHAKVNDGEWVSSSAALYGEYKKYLMHTITPPLEVLEWAGLSGSAQTSVIIDGVDLSLEEHNDHGRTFLELADAIEEQL